MSFSAIINNPSITSMPRRLVIYQSRLFTQSSTLPMASSRIISQFPGLFKPLIQLAGHLRSGVPGPYTTAEHQILRHHANPVTETKCTTASDKEWARGYVPVSNIIVHSLVSADGLTHANFDGALMPLDADDVLRMKELSVPSNSRHWFLGKEADCENYFNTEVANVTLAAWRRYPTVIQASHCRPLSSRNIPETIDSVFSARYSGGGSTASYRRDEEESHLGRSLAIQPHIGSAVPG